MARREYLQKAFSPFLKLFSRPSKTEIIILAAGELSFANAGQNCCLVIVEHQQIKSFPDDDDARSFCGPCRSRSYCTECAV